MSDFICDIDSGGRSMLFLPWSEIHLVDNREQRAAMVDAMLAWLTDYHFVLLDIAGSGLLTVEAERQGKVVVGTELGGGGHVTASLARRAVGGPGAYPRKTSAVAGRVSHRASLCHPVQAHIAVAQGVGYLILPDCRRVKPQ